MNKIFSNSAIAFGFLISTFLPSLVLPSSANAEAAAVKADAVKDQAFTSYLNYQLKPAHFQELFRPLIDRIIAGSEPKPQPAKLKEVLSEIAQRKTTESRGRLDSLYFLEGYTWEKMGNLNEALKSYEQAYKLKSQSPLYLFRHAFLLKETKHCDKAYVEFQQVAWQVRQASAEPLYLAGECLQTLNKPDDAKRMFAEAEKRNPHFAPALKKRVDQIADDLTKTFDPKLKSDLEAQMKTALESIVLQNPADHESGLRLAELYLNAPRATVVGTTNLTRAGDLATAAADASAYKDERAVKDLIDAQRRLGKTEDAVATLKKGLEASPKSEILQAIQKEVRMEEQLQEGMTDSR